MKIIYSKHFPPHGFGAINLFGLVVVRKDYGKLSEAEKNHELIHTRQIIEMLFLFFYICYVLEWIIKLIKYNNRYEAYENISFEREAYTNMYNSAYLKQRKLFAFVNYFKEKKK